MSYILRAYGHTHNKHNTHNKGAPLGQGMTMSLRRD